MSDEQDHVDMDMVQRQIVEAFERARTTAEQEGVPLDANRLVNNIKEIVSMIPVEPYEKDIQDATKRIYDLWQPLLDEIETVGNLDDSAYSSTERQLLMRVSIAVLFLAIRQDRVVRSLSQLWRGSDQVNMELLKDKIERDELLARIQDNVRNVEHQVDENRELWISLGPADIVDLFDEEDDSGDDDD